MSAQWAGLGGEGLAGVDVERWEGIQSKHKGDLRLGGPRVEPVFHEGPWWMHFTVTVITTPSPGLWRPWVQPPAHLGHWPLGQAWLAKYTGMASEGSEQGLSAAWAVQVMDRTEGRVLHVVWGCSERPG